MGLVTLALLLLNLLLLFETSCAVSLRHVLERGEPPQPKAENLSKEPEPPRSLITECTQFNMDYAMGDGTCEMCTRLRYSLKRAEEELNYTVEVREYPGLGRNANSKDSKESKKKNPLSEFYSLKKHPGGKKMGAKPTSKNRPRPCMWCPETQLCGSPNEEEVTKPCGAQYYSGAWVGLDRCTVSGSFVGDAYDEQVDIREDRMRSLSLSDQAKLGVMEAHASTLPLTTAAREGINESDMDAVVECQGRCVDHGMTHCDLQILLLPSDDMKKRAIDTSLLETSSRRTHRTHNGTAAIGLLERHSSSSSRSRLGAHRRKRKWSFEAGEEAEGGGGGDEEPEAEEQEAEEEGTDGAESSSFPINEAMAKLEEEAENPDSGLAGAVIRQNSESAGDVWAGAYPEGGHEDYVLTHMYNNEIHNIESPLPCKFDIQDNPPFFMRAWGKYTPEKWVDCRLIRCTDASQVERERHNVEKEKERVAKEKEALEGG